MLRLPFTFFQFIKRPPAQKRSCKSSCNLGTNLTTSHISFRVPIEELFYHGKNPRGVKNKQPASPVTTTTRYTTVAASTESSDVDYYDDFDIWDDYYDTFESGDNVISTNPISGNSQVTNSTKEGK